MPEGVDGDSGATKIPMTIHWTDELSFALLPSCQSPVTASQPSHQAMSSFFDSAALQGQV